MFQLAYVPSEMAYTVPKQQTHNRNQTHSAYQGQSVIKNLNTTRGTFKCSWHEKTRDHLIGAKLISIPPSQPPVSPCNLKWGYRHACPVTLSVTMTAKRFGWGKWQGVGRERGRESYTVCTCWLNQHLPWGSFHRQTKSKQFGASLT